MIATSSNRISLTSFRPVVTSTVLAEHKVVRAEQVAERTRADGIHGTRLEIDEDRAGNILVRAGLVVVYRDTLELEVIVAGVVAVLVEPVLVRDNLPELDTCT